MSSDNEVSGVIGLYPCVSCGNHPTSSPVGKCSFCSLEEHAFSKLEQPNSTQPLFESNAGATLERVKSTFCQRGNEYGDTWKNCQFLTMKAIARKFGITIPDKFYRALSAAALCDMKHQRLEGGYKDDSLVDGIAYEAFLAEEVRKLEQAQ